MMIIRPELTGHRTAIAEIVSAAYGGPESAQRLARLRLDGDVLAALVALMGETVVGQITLSACPLKGEGRPLRGAVLGPMAVLPAYQRRGIGTALVQAALSVCRSQGVRAVIGLETPEFLARFGFTAADNGDRSPPASGYAMTTLLLRPDLPMPAELKPLYPGAWTGAPPKATPRTRKPIKPQ
jgi:putative acetyltransferase